MSLAFVTRHLSLALFPLCLFLKLHKKIYFYTTLSKVSSLFLALLNSISTPPANSGVNVLIKFCTSANVWRKRHRFAKNASIFGPIPIIHCVAVSTKHSTSSFILKQPAKKRKRWIFKRILNFPPKFNSAGNSKFLTYVGTLCKFPVPAYQKIFKNIKTRRYLRQLVPWSRKTQMMHNGADWHR